MLTLEMAIEKIQQFSSEQRKQVIQFIEFLDFTANQTTTAPEPPSPDAEEAFFELAGIWENKDITAESLRAEAWRETKS
ncbi:MAG: DUF2281 domain-containing protein [Coleofasciculus sp. G1-WW12-02]|uniref:DUF2281 domain-containing protein n=1 Tax=Coleofasciculus sp. G1-WW12-02 TaxID=3068483 RepID=UPI0032F1117F